MSGIRGWVVAPSDGSLTPEFPCNVYRFGDNDFGESIWPPSGLPSAFLKSE